MTITSLTIRRVLPLAATLLCGVAISACGSSSNASTTAAAAAGGAGGAAGGNFAAVRTKLTACLKKQGVTLPAGGFGGRPGGPGAGGFAGGRPPGAGATGRAGVLFGAGRRFGGTGRFGTSGRFGPGGFGVSGRFGTSGRFGAFAGSSKDAAAFRACASQVGFGGGFGASGRFGPGGAPGGAGGGAQFLQQREAEVTKFVACVAKNGYTLPKPNFGGGPVFPNALQTNQKFLAAAKSCESLLQAPGGGAGAPPGAPA